jgi:hypothetical protein
LNRHVRVHLLVAMVTALVTALAVAGLVQAEALEEVADTLPQMTT